MVDTNDGEPTPGAVRIIEVRFEVRPGRESEIGSISDGFGIGVPAGVYQLRFECERPADNQMQVIRLRFVEMEQPRFAVIRADADLDLSGRLLLTAAAVK